MSNIKEIVEVVGPALRGLLAEGSALGVVSFEEGGGREEGDGVMGFVVPEGVGEDGVIEALRAGVEGYKGKCGKLPSVIVVKDVGAFRAVAAQGCGRVAGKIVVVTGGAQGFGVEMARGFAAEGGMVVLADINAEGARREAGEICAKYGEGRALGVGVDVTSGESVGACLQQVVRAFGGFDVLISNAGVLRAESVKTQSEKEFEFVTAVNYKGYFNCVQKAAPILARQHKAMPAYWSDIIQINSKSGLQGSNKNGAYAGSKFGGIGLTQSFAMELMGDGIKVNAICPGNFFEGPLWADPENGLFAQYLRTGKVPGAKTVEEVKRFYEAKVPLGRGCRVEDVMKAVFYVMEQGYETGQAVPVTGGQVMLS